MCALSWMIDLHDRPKSSPVAGHGRLDAFNLKEFVSTSENVLIELRNNDRLAYLFVELPLLLPECAIKGLNLGPGPREVIS